MPGMEEGIPEPTVPGEAGGGAPTFTPLQRLLAAIALVALLASAAISSWWILNGKVDFVDALGGRPSASRNAPETRTPPDHRQR